MKGAIFIVLAFLANIVSAQYIQNVGMIDGATGNLVYTTVNPPPQGADPFTWSGFTTSNIDGGGYSGGYMPNYNPTTGTFMFGYTQSTVAYSTPVNYALAKAGTNIQVNGFKYSWEYYNQDDYRGTLTGNINLTSTNGQLLQNYNYNMPQTQNGWTRMSGTENFSTQYPGSMVGSLNVSFTGKDDRWWAGYYGPQIRGIDVSLLYSVAPPPIPTDFLKWVPLANENDSFTLASAGVVRYGAQGTYIYQSFEAGTYSCSNGAWGRDPIGGVYKSCSLGSNNLPPPPTVPKTVTAESSLPLLDPVATIATVDPVTAATTTPTSIIVDPATSTATITTASTPTSLQPSAVTAVVSAPAPATSSSTASTSNSTSTSSSQSSTKESSGSGGGNVSLALSVISKNSERDAAGSAVAQSAVAQAQQAASQAQQEATSVASNAASNSTTMNAASAVNQQASSNGARVNNSNSTNFTLQSGVTSSSLSVSGPQLSSNTLVQPQNSSSTSTTIANNQPAVIINTGTQQASSNTSTAMTLPLLPAQLAPVAPNNIVTQTEAQQSQTATLTSAITQTTETYSIVPPSFLTDRTNPLNDVFEAKQIATQSSSVATLGPSVNRNVSDNDVAGGVDINKMATAPTGYGDYLNFTMRDIAFYTPKEVYKNQRNVDNARALRLLTNDSKHKDMVEMQYTK